MIRKRRRLADGKSISHSSWNAHPANGNECATIRSELRVAEPAAKLEVPVEVIHEDHAGTAVGSSDLLPGVEWRFFEDRESGFNLAFTRRRCCQRVTTGAASAIAARPKCYHCWRKRIGPNGRTTATSATGGKMPLASGIIGTAAPRGKTGLPTCNAQSNAVTKRLETKPGLPSIARRSMLNKTGILDAIATSSDSRIAQFHGQMIGDLELQNHTFDGPVNFSGAIFTGKAEFSEATFREFASFDSAVF